MKIKDTKFVPCDFGNGNTYKKIMKKILNYADEVVFTITPFLENDDEFKNSRWSALSDSFLYSVYDTAPSDWPNDKPAFMKNGEIFCYTISHEEACDIEEALWEQMLL